MVAPRKARRLTAAGLIAPCGINCGRCLGHLRPRNPCPGCRVEDSRKPRTRAQCDIRNCRERDENFCGGCSRYPCALLVRLASRYRRKYATDLIANLRRIRAAGVRRFVAGEKAAWMCAGCGHPVCLHTGACLCCGNAAKPMPQK